jgi:uncharacterized membrane protein
MEFIESLVTSNDWLYNKINYIKEVSAMSQPNPQPAVKTDESFWIYLSYIFGWILGLIALAVVKDDERIRFQCAQAIVLSAVLTVAVIVLGIFSGIFLWFAFFLFWFFRAVIYIAVLAYYVYAIILILQIAQNQNPRVPVAGDFAEKNLVKLFK